MANVWKIGSRWSREGDVEKSIFSLFVKYNIVFAGDKGLQLKKRGVKKDDYFAIADGLRIKAVAKVKQSPDYILNFLPDNKINTLAFEKSFFDLKTSNPIGCKVEIKTLSKDKYLKCTRGAFFRIKQEKLQNEVIKLFETETSLYNLENELELNDKLSKLFLEWKGTLKDQQFEKNYTEDDFIRDGFYPFYTKQSKKILFIGREALGLKGKNSYIYEIFKAYKNKRIGNKYINRHQFHSLMFKLTYSICKGEYTWDKIPKPDALTKEFGSPDGISFAFMNISKFANRSKNWTADTKLINSFITASKNGDYINREIELLNPDIIITMNFDDNKLSLVGQDRTKDLKNSTVNVDFYDFELNGKSIVLADMWHFSAPGKSPEKNYWAPLLEGLKEKNIID